MVGSSKDPYLEWNFLEWVEILRCRHHCHPKKVQFENVKYVGKAIVVLKKGLFFKDLMQTLEYALLKKEVS